MKTLALLFSIAVSCTCNSASPKVENAFLENQIVPDSIPIAPKKIVNVSEWQIVFVSIWLINFECLLYDQVLYPSGVSAELGNVLTPTQVKDKPTLTWDAENGAFYSVLLVDPDAPSRQMPKFREYRHWLVMNIPGSSIDQGEEIIGYIGSGPPKNTGLHRYIYLIYKQPNGFIQHNESRSTNR